MFCKSCFSVCFSFNIEVIGASGLHSDTVIHMQIARRIHCHRCLAYLLGTDLPRALEKVGELKL